MNALDIGLRASVIVLAALAASLALRKRSAALRHWVLAAGILSAAAVAPLGVALPAWDLPLSSPDSGVTGRLADTGRAPATGREPRPVSSPSTTGTPATFDAALAINRVWATGIAINLLVIAVGLRRLSQLTAVARPLADARWLAAAQSLTVGLNLRAEVLLRQTDLPTTLGTWGWRRPCVLLPAGCETWSDDRRHVVLGHELAHIRRGDWALQMAADVVRAVFWYNPLFWFACARLRRESEVACDNAVLESGVPAADYADHLLQIARTCRPPSPLATLVPMARRSTLEWRIAAMLNHTLIRTRPTRRTLTLILAVIVGITLTTASFRAKEQVGPLPLIGTVYDVTGAVLPGFMSLAQDVRLDSVRNWDMTLTIPVGSIQETITVKEQRPSSAAGRVERAPVRIGGNIKAPRKLVDVRPVYPSAMRDAGLDGVVSLTALIDVEGRVVSVRVIGSPAHPDLGRAAAEAVRQWQFSPTLLNGEAVEVLMNVQVSFSLED